MDPINDPAWFYSSLAQTAAAIVGLIGAVLGSRIIDHISILRAKRRELDAKIAQVRQCYKDKREQFAAHRDYLQREIAETELWIHKGNQRPIFGEQNLMGGGWGSSESRPVVASEYKSHLDAEMNFLPSLEAAYPAFAGPVITKQLIDCPLLLFSCARSVPAEIRQADNVVNTLRADGESLNNLRTDVFEFGRQLLPNSFKLFFVLLVWLLITGVFWPMTALPGLTASWLTAKLGMICAFGLGLLGLVAFFVYQFYELRQLGRLTWDVKKPS